MPCSPGVPSGRGPARRATRRWAPPTTARPSCSGPAPRRSRRPLPASSGPQDHRWRPGGPTTAFPWPRRAVTTRQGALDLAHAVLVILERVVLSVKAGQEVDFEPAFGPGQGDHRRQCQASAGLRARVAGSARAPTCSRASGTVCRTIRRAWRARRSTGQWRRLLHGFYEPFPVVGHYEKVHSPDRLGRTALAGVTKASADPRGRPPPGPGQAWGAPGQV